MFSVEEILAKSDLLAYVERAGGTPKGNGNRYACACPLHGGNNTTAFSIYFKDGRWRWNCFTGTCGGGDSIRFVEVWQNLNFKQACEWINGGAIEDSDGMKESAERRLEAARQDAQKAKDREEARRHELQVAERHVFYHKTMTQFHRDEWTKAGIDEGMQDFWNLGGCEDFTYKSDGCLYHSPTLTIPILGEACELLTIQHRLMNPHNPKDKYRPETVGLHSHPFLAVPEMGYDGDLILVMEGAKKAMVSWIHCDTTVQCIGVPAQREYIHLAERLSPVGKRVIVIPDPNSDRNPNAVRLGWELAKAVGGRYLQMPAKIDDYLNSVSMKPDQFYFMLKQARHA